MQEGGAYWHVAIPDAFPLLLSPLSVHCQPEVVWVGSSGRAGELGGQPVQWAGELVNRAIQTEGAGQRGYAGEA